MCSILWCWDPKQLSLLFSSEGSLSLCRKSLWSSHSFGAAECRNHTHTHTPPHPPLKEKTRYSFHFLSMRSSSWKEYSVSLVFQTSINRSVPRLWPGVYSRFMRLMIMELGYQTVHLVCAIFRWHNGGIGVPCILGGSYPWRHKKFFKSIKPVILIL